MSAQRGSGLLELMLAVSLSLMLVLSAIVLLHAANAGFIWQEQSALMQDSAAVATESIARALRQTAYIDYAQVPGERSGLPADGVVWGADASSPASAQADSRAISATSILGSDVLAVRFAVSGNVADGSVINCAGFAVPRAHSLSANRGISIFYVAASGTGQTELRCKYRGSHQWDSQALIAGVESFQVLYEIDTDGDGMTDQTVNASAIALRDATDNPSVSLWTRVVAVHIALLLQGQRSVVDKTVPARFDLFGAAYSATHGSDDRGTRIFLTDLPAASHKQPRHLFHVVITLRNPAQAVLYCEACTVALVP